MLDQFESFSWIFEFLIWWGIFIGIALVLFVVYKIIMYLVRRTIRKLKASPSVINGIRFVMRLVFILVIFGIFISLSNNLIPGGIPLEITLIISTVVGTVFALSTTTVIQNFISGIFLIITRPFRIGDLIRIDDQEGIVEEISLNHTKLRKKSGIRHYISNQSIIGSKIVNFRIKLSPYGDSDGDGEITIKDVFVKRDVYQYAYTIELPKENPVRTREILDGVSEKYKDKFYKPPEFLASGISHKVIMSVVLVADDPEVILQTKDKINKDIYDQTYSS